MYVNFINFIFGLNGKPVEKSKYEYPYSYDCHVTWSAPQFETGHDFENETEIVSMVYSDRLFHWDYEKFNKCCQEVWKNSSQTFYINSPRTSNEIEKFLQLYYSNPNLQLLVIGEGANKSTGFPYWVFGIKY